MVLIREYIIPMPISVEEYQIAQIHMVSKASEGESGDGGAGVEILKNEKFENEEMGKGQYTKKVYHLGSKVPSIVAKIFPADALILDEEAWNAYPKCKTIITSRYMEEKFRFIIETIHLEDKGDNPNAHGLDESVLKTRQTELIDITELPFDKCEEDPTTFVSESGRGPVKSGWFKDPDYDGPHMCCYKLVTVEFKKWGFQTAVEKLAMSFEHDIFLKTHKQMYCWMDEWESWTLKDARKYEKKMNKKINQKMKQVVGNAAMAGEEVEGEATEPSSEDEAEKKKKKKKKKKDKGGEEAPAAAKEAADDGEDEASAETPREKEKEKKKKKKKKEKEESKAD